MACCFGHEDNLIPALPELPTTKGLRRHWGVFEGRKLDTWHCEILKSPTTPELTNGKVKPIFAQNSFANWHPMITCSAVSLSCWQISQIAVSTTFFSQQLDRVWILPCMSKHVQNWTLFGAKLSQTKLAAGMGLPSHDFKSLCTAPPLLSTASLNCVAIISYLASSNSAIACCDSLQTKK